MGEDWGPKWCPTNFFFFFFAEMFLTTNTLTVIGGGGKEFITKFESDVLDTFCKSH